MEQCRPSVYVNATCRVERVQIEQLSSRCAMETLKAVLNDEDAFAAGVQTKQGQVVYVVRALYKYPVDGIGVMTGGRKNDGTRHPSYCLLSFAHE